MRTYETLVIFNPDLSESGIKSEIEKVHNLITAKQGKDIKLENEGKKSLAYVVRKQKFGYFVTFTYASDNSDIIDEVTHILRITDSIIKFQSHRTNLPKRKFKGNLKRAQKGDAFDDDEAIESDFV